MPRTAMEPELRSNTDLSLTHQIYITHCLHGEGLFRKAGFDVRASSTTDPLLHRFAQSYPPYELPAGMGDSKLPPDAAPRRLALVRIPGGNRALIHSVYLPDGNRGRANNFLSHIIVRPALKAREAFTSWAASEWQISIDPGTDQRLSPLAELPLGSSVHDLAVTEFLQTVDPLKDRNLATLTCPHRLGESPKQRRELVCLAIRGCQLALSAGLLAARGRFYILAEPGLTALLLYAAVRLLPEALASNLTFSTYEPARWDLRQYKHTNVVGTYILDPEGGLDEDLFTTRGYALDTFNYKFSPELGAEANAEIDEWIDLAARGEWATIDRVHDQLGEKSATFVSLKQALEAAKMSSQLETGQATATDLLALAGSACGPAILNKHRDQVWHVVRDASLSDERIREEFAGMLRKHLSQLEREAALALKTQPPTDWQPRLRLISSLVREDPRRKREIFRRIIPGSPFPADLRVHLLRELHDLGLSPLELRQRLHSLLNGCSNQELEELARAEAGREWFIWALFYALLNSDTRSDAVRYLHAGDDAIVRLFWEQFQLLKEENHRRAILAPLFPCSDEGARFLSRSLKNGCSLRPETMTWLLNFLRSWKKEWMPFWSRENHLGFLVEVLKKHGHESRHLWERLCEQLDREVLVPGDTYQRAYLMELAAAKDRPGPAVPEKAAQVIGDWIFLREHFEKASAVPETDKQAVIDACNRCGLDPFDMLRGYFEQFILPQGIKSEVLDDFLGFFHSFHVGREEYQDYSSRLVWWLRVVEGCPNEAQKASYQRYYLEHSVPFEFRWRLAQETHAAGKLPLAVYEEMQKPTEPAKTQETASSTLVDDNAYVFQLAGVRPLTAAQTDSLLLPVGKRLRWLYPSIAGGILAAVLSGLLKDKLQTLAVLAMFIPAVYALAGSVAIQSAALAFLGLQGKAPTRTEIWRNLGRELLTGLLLGVVCGLIVGSLAKVWGGQLQLAVNVGAALGGGMAIAALLGGVMPLLLRYFHWGSRVAAGTLVQPAAGVGALLLYFTLARWLLG